ncbi:hypothetical protein [Candidatus Enterovibrio escicola]|uniref:hypothetical protein n=1 Tax=Candidatus Enterovibrio escicola TaxID=1927127 RepID=UPI001237D39C|nr:hypothetical protein [Candidatus Enterovibrio escacola]
MLEKRSRKTRFQQAEEDANKAAFWELKADSRAIKDRHVLALILSHALNYWEMATNKLDSLTPPQSKGAKIKEKRHWYNERARQCSEEIKSCNVAHYISSESDYD